MTILHRRSFERRPLPADSPYIPPEARAPAEAEAAERAVAVEPPADSHEPRPEQRINAVTQVVKETIDQLAERGLLRLPAEANRNRLNEIASLVRFLTFGDMMELAEAIWNLKQEGEITQEMLPGMLHKWSNGRCGNT